MLVRTATIDDIETLVDFGKRLTREAPNFKGQGFQEDLARRLFERLIEKLDSIFLVLDEFKNPVGGLIGVIDTDWRTGQKLAFEQGVYVLPEYRRSGAAHDLVEAFIEWAELHKADRVQVGTITGIHADKTISLYESMGFKLRGYVLEMEV